MNKILLLAGVAALFATNAQAVEISPYIGAKLKFVDMQTDVDLEDTLTSDINDKVFGGSIALGAKAKLSNGAFRAELEYNRNSDAEKNNEAATLMDDGDIVYSKDKFTVETQSVMANLYYDFDTCSKFTPYVGAGLGYAKVKGKMNMKYAIGVVSWDEYELGSGSMDDNNLAWQVGFGGSYAVNTNVSLDAGYRYIDYGKIKEDGDKFDTSAHELYVGARYTF